MGKIEERLDILESKIDQILELLNGDLKSNCDKMAGHIEFVENVYDKVKKPLGYICNKVKSFSGNSNLLEDTK